MDGPMAGSSSRGGRPAEDVTVAQGEAPLSLRPSHKLCRAVSHVAGWSPPAPHGVTKGHRNHDWAGQCSCKPGCFPWAAF